MTTLGRTTASELHLRHAARSALRVCIVVTAEALPAWLDETLAALRKADFLETHLVRAPATPARRQGGRAWRLFQALDRRLLGELAPIVQMRPLAAEFAAAPLIDDPAALQANVGSFGPDVLLTIGRSPAPIDLWPMARRAAWSFSAEACQPDWTLLHLLPAFIRGEPTALSGLPVTDDRTGSALLLDPAVVSIAQLSFARNTAYQLQKAPAKLLRALRHVHAGEPLRGIAAEAGRPPDTFAALAIAVRIASRSVARHLPRLGRWEHWTLATRRQARGMDPAAPQPDGFALWPTPSGWFWADPCPWRHEGREHVFFEAFDYRRSIGEIHGVEVDAEGLPGAPFVVMAGEHHLSYPFLFEHDGRPHLLVECAAARRIEAFEPEQYPERWRPVATLLEGWRAVDATLHWHEGRWWLFTCVAETPFDDGGREFNELFLFHAPGPFGPWTPHRQNPVVTDVRRARPAGPLFVHEGRLIRPGQDCAAEYGQRIVFNAISRLDPDHYDETPLEALEPDWAPGLRGCHTYARCGTLEILDAKSLVTRARTIPAADPRA